jgi:hypothetical protein
MATTNLDDGGRSIGADELLVVTTHGRFTVEADSWACGSDNNIHLYDDSGTHGDTVATIEGARFVAVIESTAMGGPFIAPDDEQRSDTR